MLVSGLPPQSPQDDAMKTNVTLHVQHHPTVGKGPCEYVSLSFIRLLAHQTILSCGRERLLLWNIYTNLVLGEKGQV